MNEPIWGLIRTNYPPSIEVFTRDYKQATVLVQRDNLWFELHSIREVDGMWLMTYEDGTERLARPDAPFDWVPISTGVGEPTGSERPDPPCSGPGFAHAPHGECPGYGTDRT